MTEEETQIYGISQENSVSSKKNSAKNNTQKINTEKKKKGDDICGKSPKQTCMNIKRYFISKELQKEEEE